MTDWTAADLPSFAGRTVIVTGANSGLGAVTARELARNGAKIIMAVRNTGKGEAAAQQMTGEVEVRGLDLQDLSSVRQFADGVDKADMLINNAGIMAVPYARDRRRVREPDRHQPPRAFRADQPAAAQAHRPGRHGVLDGALAGRISLDDLNWKTRRYRPWLAYSQSKLANLLFTSELQRRLDAAGRRCAQWPPIPATRTPTCRGPPAASCATAHVGRHPGGRHRRRLRCPANAVRGVAGHAGRHVRRPPIRLRGPDPAGRAQPGGAGRGHRDRAVGAVRAAHRHQISALSARRCANLTGRHGEGGWRPSTVIDGDRRIVAILAVPRTRYRHTGATPWPRPQSTNSPPRSGQTGKGASRRARRDGKIPAVLYGHGADPQHWNCPDTTSRPCCATRAPTRC